MINKTSILIISILLISMPLVLGFGFNVDTSGSTVNINVQQTLQNTTDLGDVNTSMSPNGNDVLTYDAGTSTWTSKSAQSAGDTNETARFTKLVQDDCPSGKLVIGIQNNGTVLCATDSTGGSGGGTDGTGYLYNDSTNMFLNGTKLNTTIDQRATGITNNTKGWTLNFSKIFSFDWTNVTITESQISDLSHTIDTDTNASTQCSTDEVLLGNTSCMTSSVFFDGTGGNSSWNESYANGLYSNIKWGYNQTDTYTAGTNITVSNNIISLDITALRNWLDQVYQVIGNFFDTTDSPYLYNNNTAVFFNETKLNQTIDDRAPAGSSDGNASSICSGIDEVLLGNGSCQTSSVYFDDTTVGNNGITLVEANITDLSHTSPDNSSWNESYANGLYSTGSHTVIWDNNFNASFDQRDQSGGNASFNQSLTDTLYSDIKWGYNQTDTYTAGSNITVSNNIISLDVTALRNWLDQVYQTVGSYLTAGDLPLTDRVISHWDNVTNKPVNLDTDSTDDLLTTDLPLHNRTLVNWNNLTDIPPNLDTDSTNDLTAWDNNLAWKNTTNTFTKNQKMNLNLTIQGSINQSVSDGITRYFDNGCYEKVNSTGWFMIC